MTAVACRRCPRRASHAFRPVSEAELDFIQRFKRNHREAKAGATLIAEREIHGQLFTLFAGIAFRYMTLSDGRRQILNFLLPGDFVGLQEQLDGESPHGVEALTDVEMCVFDADGLMELYRQHPRLGHDVTWLASHEERILDGNLLSVGRRSAQERVAMLLIHFHKRMQALDMGQADGSVPFPLTQQHIADALGLSLVHTNKTLRRLREMGLVRWQDGRLALPQPRVLQRVADYFEQPVPQRPLI
jgi:CRP-like cAMP-binding protein